MCESNIDINNTVSFDVNIESCSDKLYGNLNKTRSKDFFIIHPINDKYTCFISPYCMKIPKKYRRNKRMLKKYNFYCQLSFNIVNLKFDDETVLDLFLDCFYDLQKQYSNQFNVRSKNNQRESSVFLAVAGQKYDNPDVLAYELLFELYPSNKLTFKNNPNAVLDSIGDYSNEIEKYIIIDNVSIKCLSDKDFDDEI